VSRRPVRAKTDAILARIPKVPCDLRERRAFDYRIYNEVDSTRDAQLVWQQPTGPNDAVACVFVKHAEMDATPPSPAPTTRDSPGKEPPMAPPNHKMARPTCRCAAATMAGGCRAIERGGENSERAWGSGEVTRQNPLGKAIVSTASANLQRTIIVTCSRWNTSLRSLAKKRPSLSRRTVNGRS